MPKMYDMFFGNYGGSIGETCTLALLIGGIYLLVRKVITWHIPVVFIGTVFVFSYAVTGDAATALNLTMAGGVFIGAFFMATDYVTSPSTSWGKVVFGLGAGILTCLIRFFGTYPEGVSFAILFMNILNPYIEQWTQNKIFANGGKK
jgi:electron transport complex protein RnfD